MKKIVCSLFITIITLSLVSCEELVSKSFDNETIKKLRTENTSLKVQLDKLQRQLRKDKDEMSAKNLIISMYDLRHAVEKYALNNHNDYPTAENITELNEIVKEYLPKDFTIDLTFLETIKSSSKGYIFIANINDQKIVVSNLI
jgi:hypothetical protein